MGEGLAATMAGQTMTYGDGSKNTIRHAYGGAESTPKRQTTKKKKKESK